MGNDNNEYYKYINSYNGYDNNGYYKYNRDNRTHRGNNVNKRTHRGNNVNDRSRRRNNMDNRSLNNYGQIDYLNDLKQMIKKGGALFTMIALTLTLSKCFADDKVEINEAGTSAIERTIKLNPQETEEHEVMEIPYTVESGDTLEGIANRFGTSVEHIAKRNNITYENLIQIGSTLIIPNVEARKEKYTVKEGDSLESIANKFNTSIEQILEDNDISNKDIIYAGENLTVPIMSFSTNDTTNSSKCVNLEDKYIRVIDISELNEAINWEELEEEYKNGTFSHIIMRINENYNPDNGLREFVVDKYFEKNLSECNKRNIPYGVYSLSRGTTPDEINIETENLINYINYNLNRTKELNGELLDLTFNLSLPIYMDCFEEDANYQYQLYLDGKYDYCGELVNLWCDTMQNAGYFPGVYCMNAAYQAIGNDRLPNRSLWIADYGNEIYDNVENIGLNGRIELNSLISGHQVTSKGSINGIYGPVDVSIFDKEILNNVENFYTNSNKVR